MHHCMLDGFQHGLHGYKLQHKPRLDRVDYNLVTDQIFRVIVPLDGGGHIF